MTPCRSGAPRAIRATIRWSVTCATRACSRSPAAPRRCCARWSPPLFWAASCRRHGTATCRKTSPGRICVATSNRHRRAPKFAPDRSPDGSDLRGEDFALKHLALNDLALERLALEGLALEGLGLKECEP